MTGQSVRNAAPSTMGGRWQWVAKAEVAFEEPCAACRRINDKFPAGVVTFRGEFAREHKEEMVRLARHQEEEAEGASGSMGYLPHGLSSKGRDDQHDGPNSFRREKSLEAVPLWSSAVSISEPAARCMISHTMGMMLAAMSVI